MRSLRARLLALGAAVGLTVAVLPTVGCAWSGSSAGKEAEDARPPLSEENQALARGFLAATEIRGQNLITVQETVESVFTSAGLAVIKRTAEEVAFERPATRRERGAYGTWFGEDVRVRLRVEIIQQGGGVFFLRCGSRMARDAGSNAEDEQDLARRHVRNYEGLLDEVSARLN